MQLQQVSEVAAQVSENVHAVDTVWVALCAALIFQMEGGFALLEAGFIRGYFAFDMGITDRDLGLTISNKLFWFIQLGFAMAAVSIVSGAIAERMKIWAYAFFVLLFCAVLYPLAANWVWNPDGWLAARGIIFPWQQSVHLFFGLVGLDLIQGLP